MERLSAEDERSALKGESRERWAKLECENGGRGVQAVRRRRETPLSTFEMGCPPAVIVLHLSDSLGSPLLMYTSRLDQLDNIGHAEVACNARLEPPSALLALLVCFQWRSSQEHEIDDRLMDSTTEQKG